jgi:elongator complex protein 4
MTELHVRLKQQQHHAHTPHSVPGMSAFVRRQPARTVDLGTRPGLHGQVLISSGLAGIDRLLGGGLPLGCVLLVIEDAHSQQHLNLLRCFLAEGVCCKHSLALLTAQQLDADGLAALLPDQAKPSGSSGSTEAGSGGAATGGPRSSMQVGCGAWMGCMRLDSMPWAVSDAAVLCLRLCLTRVVACMQAAAAGAQPPAPAASGAPDDGLKIAWQYRKYINNSTQQQSARASSSAAPKQPSSGGSSSSSASAAAKAVAAGIGREWCHQFDLSKGLSREQLAASKLQLHCCCPSTLGQPGAHNEQQQQQQQQGDRGSTPMQAVQAAAAAAQAFLSLFQPKGAIPGALCRAPAAARCVIDARSARHTPVARLLGALLLPPPLARPCRTPAQCPAGTLPP